jgi:hypothetical protein
LKMQKIEEAEMGRVGSKMGNGHGGKESEDGDGDVSTIMGAGSDVQGDFFGGSDDEELDDDNDDDGNESEDEDMDMDMEVIDKDEL